MLSSALVRFRAHATRLAYTIRIPQADIHARDTVLIATR